MKEEEQGGGPLQPINKLKNRPLRPNRGMELLLNKNRREKEPSKLFQVKFGKLISLFGLEIHFLIDFHLIKNKKNQGEEK
jgi:hypothetical protein